LKKYIIKNHNKIIKEVSNHVKKQSIFKDIISKQKGSKTRSSSHSSTRSSSRFTRKNPKKVYGGDGPDMRDIISLIVFAISYITASHIHSGIEHRRYTVEDTVYIRYMVGIICIISLLNVDYTHFQGTQNIEMQPNFQHVRNQSPNESQLQIISQLNGPTEQYDNTIRVNDKECCVCMLELNNDTDNNNIIQLKCNHFFHKLCLLDWVQKTSNTSCPICRGPVEIKKIYKHDTILQYT
jgi:E3 ubiquitin-protein ligase DOA10